MVMIWVSKTCRANIIIGNASHDRADGSDIDVIRAVGNPPTGAEVSPYRAEHLYEEMRAIAGAFGGVNDARWYLDKRSRSDINVAVSLPLPGVTAPGKPQMMGEAPDKGKCPLGKALVQMRAECAAVAWP